MPADNPQLDFDFSDFIDAAKLQFTWDKKPVDFPYEDAYHLPQSQDIFSIVGKRIELKKDNTPTRRGWKTLENILSAYRDKRFETMRYLLVNDDGKIVDHIALTNHFPNKVLSAPGKEDKGMGFLLKILERADKTNSRIIAVHNHPSGEVNPSDEDKKITQKLGDVFTNRFSGHVILDHGSFGLYTPASGWEMVEKPKEEIDPLRRADRHNVYNEKIVPKMNKDKMALLHQALKVDAGDHWNSEDWTAVAFTAYYGEIKALHFYHNSEFFDKEAAEAIKNKTVELAKQSGSIWAFAFSERNELLPAIENITRETGVFRDYHVSGVTASAKGIGGNLGMYFEKAPLEVESTFDLEDNAHRISPSVFVAEDNPDYGDSSDNPFSLPQYEHLALIELLDHLRGIGNPIDRIGYYEAVTGNSDFEFLKAIAPSIDEINDPHYEEIIGKKYLEELHAYAGLYPDAPYPEFTSRPNLTVDEVDSSMTLAFFLSEAVKVNSVEEYRKLYETTSPFAKGQVKALTPDKIALFHERAVLPLIIEENTPEKWASLYRLANTSGIAFADAIPTPDDVDSMGLSILGDAKERLDNLMSAKWQIEEFRRDCAYAQDDSGSNALHKTFYEKPYTPGTEVPSFILQDGNDYTTYSGYRFKRMDDSGLSLTLAKDTGEEVKISSRLYSSMIDNSSLFLQKEKTTPEIMQTYNTMIEQDIEEIRINTAANFWHNYRILCREQASNPQEAMEVAKAIVKQMPEKERKKFRATITAYEKATKPLMKNPLLKPFVKPQETYNQRILNFYEENVKDLPIKDKTVHSYAASSIIRHGAEVIDVPGKPIDPSLKLKIGDTVKMTLKCQTLFGDSLKKLPITEYIVTSASSDLNKIVLIDKSGNSKFTLARDCFLARMKKIEKKLEKRQKRLDRFEALSY